MTVSRRTLLKGAVAGLAATAAAGCNNGAASRGPGEVIYWLWDSAQLPMYTEMREGVPAAEPAVLGADRAVRLGRLLAQAGHRVHLGHRAGRLHLALGQVPAVRRQGQVLAIDDLVSRDGVDLGIYQPGLADRWIGADGKRYGLPKDFDTEVYFYNSAFTEAAGSVPSS